MNAPKGRRPAGQADDGGAVLRAGAPGPRVARAMQSVGCSTAMPTAEHPALPAINTPKMLYSIAEAAALLSLSRAHLYRLLERGELTSIRIGRSRRVSRSELEAYVAHLEQKTGDERAPQRTSAQ